jgi:regulator of protease activity HflC (stomatin/prohibitin superfamily)
MFGIRYIKSSPSTYLIQYRDGQIRREGAGIDLLYFAPSTSLVSIPLATRDAPFMFRELTRDFQEVTVQGQASFRVTDPKALAQRMDFTLAADGVAYAADDPQKLPGRLLNAVQVQVRTLIQRESLQELLTRSAEIEAAVRDGLQGSEALAALGISLVDLAILAIRPTPETTRALEAEVREQILKRADDATYTRRNSAIEQERAIRENELRTEIAVEEKKRQIRETQMDAERAVLEKRQQIEDQAMTGRIALETRNRELVALTSENARKEADDKAFAVEAMIRAIDGVDPRVLQALVIGQADPAAIIALAFQGLAENASKIGELNISPDLLQTLTRQRKG